VKNNNGNIAKYSWSFTVDTSGQLVEQIESPIGIILYSLFVALILIYILAKISRTRPEELEEETEDLGRGMDGEE
jgi:ammonia channel protein AmtB